jgi:hypothetical protein
MLSGHGARIASLGPLQPRLDRTTASSVVDHQEHGETEYEHEDRQHSSGDDKIVSFPAKHDSKRLAPLDRNRNGKRSTDR